MTQPITGAILAGGGRRGLAGWERALLPIGGEKMVERQIRIMRQLCREIIVVTDTPRPFLDLLESSVRLITDYFADCGPLGGMHAALGLARYPQVWVVGSGMPLISSEAARRLAAVRKPSGGSAVPLLGHRPVPLHGVYDKEAAETAGRLLAEGETGLERFLGCIRWQAVVADGWTAEAGIGDFACVVRTGEEAERACRRIFSENHESDCATGGCRHVPQK